MNKNLFSFILICLVGTLCVGTAAAQVWDLVEDFSYQDPNGVVWKGGWTQSLGSPFIVDLYGLPGWYFGVPSWQATHVAPTTYIGVGANKSYGPSDIFDGNASYLQPRQCWVQPAWSGQPLSQKTVARWVAPSSGYYVVNIEFSGISSFGVTGTSTDVHVLIDGTSVFDDSILGFVGSSYVSGFPPHTQPPKGNLEDRKCNYLAVLNLTAGQKVDAAVGDGGTSGGDMTGLRFTVETTTSGQVNVAESDGATNVAEEGTTSDTYTLSLYKDPGGQTVTIDITTDGQVTTDVTQVVFTTANYDQPQTIQVTAVDDAAVEGPHAGAITHTVSSTTPSDPDFNTVFDFTVNIADNDLPSMTIAETDGATIVIEGGATDTYTVVLDAPPNDTVTVTIGTDADVDVTNPANGQLTFDAGNWSMPQTVTIAAVDDAASEGPEVSTVSNTCSGGGYDGIEEDVLVNVGDNEAYCGDGSHGYWSVDLNQDCYVDLQDFVQLAGLWMHCTDPANPECD